MGLRDNRPEPAVLARDVPIGTDDPIPELVPPPARGRHAQLAREAREAWECVEADRARHEYMANLRRENPERVAEEAAEFARYVALRRSGGGGDDGLGWSVLDD